MSKARSHLLGTYTPARMQQNMQDDDGDEEEDRDDDNEVVDIIGANNLYIQQLQLQRQHNQQQQQQQVQQQPQLVQQQVPHQQRGATLTSSRPSNITAFNDTVAATHNGEQDDQEVKIIRQMTNEDGPVIKQNYSPAHVPSKARASPASAALSGRSKKKTRILSLHEHPHYIDKAAELLNSEWPWPSAMRRLWLQKSNGSLPHHLILVDDATSQVHLSLAAATFPFPLLPLRCVDYCAGAN